MRIAWVVLTKWPYPGELKTRIAKDASPTIAADLSWAMLDDTLDNLQSKVDITDVYLAMPETPTWLKQYKQATLMDQGQGDLGERLHHISQIIFKTYDGLVLLGSDSPHLSNSIMDQAIHALHDHKSALGPASDGGYYLQALPAIPKDLFSNIAWSTDSAGSHMLRKQQKQYGDVLLLPTLTDIDTVADAQQFLCPRLTPQSAKILSRLTQHNEN